MEATEKDGDPTDLWVTLEAMGYNRMLELVDVRINLCSNLKILHLIPHISLRFNIILSWYSVNIDT